MANPSPQMNPAVAVAITAHHPWLIFLGFVAGYSVNIWWHLDQTVKSKENLVTSRWELLKANGGQVAARFIISFTVFSVFWNDPSTIPSMLALVGWSPGPVVVALLTLPVSPTFAVAWGVALDNMLAYIRKLKNVLPPQEFTRRVTDVVTREHRVETAPVEAGAPTSTTTTEVSKTVKTEPEAMRKGK